MKYLTLIFLALLAITASARPYNPSEEIAMEATTFQHMDDVHISGAGAVDEPGPPVPYASAVGVVGDVVPPEDVQPAVGGLDIALLASGDNALVDEEPVTVATRLAVEAWVGAGINQPQVQPGRPRVPDGVRRAHHDGGKQDTG